MKKLLSITILLVASVLSWTAVLSADSDSSDPDAGYITEEESNATIQEDLVGIGQHVYVVIKDYELDASNVQLSFEIENSETEIVPNLQYVISLSRIEAFPFGIYIETFASSEIFNLDPGEKGSFSERFSIPSTVSSGDYYINVEVFSENKRLSWANERINIFNNWSESIPLAKLGETEPSYITLPGDSTPYPVNRGIVIESGTNITLNMYPDIAGRTDVVSSVIKFYENEVFDDNFVTSVLAVAPVEVPESGGVFSVSFDIPELPGGLYRGVFYVVTEDDQRVSETLPFRMIVSGESGIFTNISTSFTSDYKGITSTISFRPPFSIDNIAGQYSNSDFFELLANGETVGTAYEDPSVIVSVVDVNGNECVSSEVGISNEINPEDITVELTDKWFCKDPKIIMQLLSAGEVINEQVIHAPSYPSVSFIERWYVWGAVASILVFVMVVYLLSKIRRKNNGKV